MVGGDELVVRIVDGLAVALRAGVGGSEHTEVGAEAKKGTSGMGSSGGRHCGWGRNEEFAFALYRGRSRSVMEVSLVLRRRAIVPCRLRINGRLYGGEGGE